MSSPVLNRSYSEPPASPLLKRQEAAEYLRISRWTLLKLSIPTVEIGKRRFYRKRDLDAYVERNVAGEN